MLPAAVPGTVLGIAYAMAFDTGPLSSWLYGNLATLVLCNLCHHHAQGFLAMSTGLAWRLIGTIVPSCRSVSRRRRACSGATRQRQPPLARRFAAAAKRPGAGVAVCLPPAQRPRTLIEGSSLSSAPPTVVAPVRRMSSWS